jgi:hypothetical protein
VIAQKEEWTRQEQLFEAQEKAHRVLFDDLFDILEPIYFSLIKIYRRKKRWSKYSKKKGKWNNSNQLSFVLDSRNPKS